MRKLLAALAVFTAVVSPLSAAEVDSALLLYQAEEAGVAPYPSRILVTGSHVRMDDGADTGDYLIFDRKTGLISSVNHEDKTVFEIPPREVAIEPPLALELHTEKLPQKDAPEVAGKKPQLNRLYVNGNPCYSVVTIPGVMGDAVEALNAFRQVLAGEHAKSLPRLPADMQEPCDMALNTFHADWLMQHGLPLQEWDGKGNRQMLMDFNERLSVDEALFTLPEGYSHYSTDDL